MIQQSVAIKNQEFHIKLFLVSFSLVLIIFGLFLNSPKEIFEGLKQIIFSKDGLITDYMTLGNNGSALINAGVLTFVSILLLFRQKIIINGVSVAAIFTIAGFALFGKNIVNVWPIVLGVYLYSKFAGQKFSQNIYVAYFGTALAPFVSEFFIGVGDPILGITLSLVVGVAIGFTLSPVAAFTKNVHQGYNLYNIGFAAGIIGMIAIAIINTLGYQVESRFIWPTDPSIIANNNLIYGIFFITLFGLFIVYGFILEKKSYKKIKYLINYSAQFGVDYIEKSGFSATLINMGVLGIMSTSYILVINGVLCGPTIGGILTIVGFGAYGKNLKNITFIVLGIYLLSLFNISWKINDPTIMIATLFGTSLSPVSTRFGMLWGILAGMIHVSLVQNVGVLHGGLNLYNNGFAAGLVSIFLVPLIESINDFFDRKIKKKKKKNIFFKIRH